MGDKMGRDLSHVCSNIMERGARAGGLTKVNCNDQFIEKFVCLMWKSSLESATDMKQF